MLEVGQDGPAEDPVIIRHLHEVLHVLLDRVHDPSLGIVIDDYGEIHAQGSHILDDRMDSLKPL